MYNFQELTIHFSSQALSDSLIGRGLEGGGAESGLVNQLREKEALLVASFRDREELSTTMLQEISRLSSALTDAENLILVIVISTIVTFSTLIANHF